MTIYENITQLIGQTPMLKIGKLVRPEMAAIFAKLESWNPMGSIKDRICLNMIEMAEQDGKIVPGDTLVEPTSGNTGVGLAYISAVKGYRLVLTMPASMSIERKKIVEAFGAEIILTPASEGMSGAIREAVILAERHGWFQLKQFENRANPDIHRQTTALEILEQVPEIDGFVAGVGTGGTISGVGEMLRKRRGNNIRIVAVEPGDSPVLSGGKPGPHQIQGIGAGFIPNVLNPDIIDEVIQISNAEAFEASRALARVEGIFAGISSGAAFKAAQQLAVEMGPGKKIVVIFPDFGERYLSTPLFDKK